MTRLYRCLLALFLFLGAATVIAPPPVQRAEAWLRFRLLGEVPPPILIGQHGRLFLGNHPGTPPGTLITNVCGGSVDGAAVAHAASMIRPVLAAARAIGVPVRFVIVPTPSAHLPGRSAAGLRPCLRPAERPGRRPPGRAAA